MIVEYRVLGPVEVLRDGVPVPVPAGRGRLLLATLLLRANQFVSVDELVDRLWDGEPPTVDRAHKTLHMVVRRLRLALGDANCVRTATGGYVAEVDPEHLDLTRFRRFAAEGRFADALGEWRGEVAQNVVSVTLHEHDEPPLVEERLVVLGRRIDADLAAGRGAELVTELERLTGEHPLREGFWAQLVRALHQAERPADALVAYERIRDHLADELGVEPGQPLRDLHERLLAGDGRTGVPKQLPSVGGFVGRESELVKLGSLATAGSAVVITAIDGTAGIGKTALAVHWAHSVAHRFPDGQLHVNLRGFDPSSPPVNPADVLKGFLEAFGVPAKKVPADLPERAALYRSVLAERRVLVLLDNARDVEQVRPLLPAGRGCLAVITSRNRFTGLVVREGALPLSLDVMPHPDAVALLTSRLGEDRVRAEPDAVTDLVAFCGGLPLALAVLASRLAGEPHLTVRALAEELADEHGRLAALDTGDPITSVSAVFATSYRQLDAATARTFRLLGLATGSDISLDAVSALAGDDHVRRSLNTLVRMHLVIERAHGRYTLHDLLRAYSRELLAAEEAKRAVRRLLDFYLHSVANADKLLRRSGLELALPPFDSSVRPMEFADSATAAAWCETEHPNLLAAARLASAHELHQHSWQLPAVMFGYANLRQLPAERAELARIALDAARAADDPYAQGIAWHSLANAYTNMGRHADADRGFAEALRVREEIGHLHGIAVTLDQWAINFALSGDLESARGLHERAIEKRREQGEPAGLATALNNYAMTLVGLEEHGLALAANTEAYDTIVAAGLDYLLASTLDTRGLLHMALGNVSEAITTFRRVLALPVDQLPKIVKATTFENLADAHLRLGRTGDALAFLRQALQAREELGSEAAAAKLRARISELS